MNVPAVAQKTFELLRNQAEFLNITKSVLSSLKKIKNSLERARFVHNMIDEYNNEVFSHPLLKLFVPCKTGCSACCHTQVSVTKDEAELLISNINSGVKIDYKLLSLQAEKGNSSQDFYQLAYKDRKCVFLDEKGSCKVYKDRPSVCRTNAVVGEASQCSTDNKEQAALRLVKTPKADMVIYASFDHSPMSGTLPMVISNLLNSNQAKENNSKIKILFEKIIGSKTFHKEIHKDTDI
jgi:Fe-S-cluster containining protein